MNNLRIIRAALAALLMGFSVVARATFILSSDGSEITEAEFRDSVDIVFEVSGETLMRAYNLPVLGGLYDVQFVYATNELLYRNFSPTVDNAADALALSRALFEYVFIAVPGGTDYDDNPNLTFGCAGKNECGVFTVYNVESGGADTAVALNFPEVRSPPDEVKLAGINGSIYLVFANWTSAELRMVSAPPAGWLLVLGAGWLVSRQRKLTSALRGSPGRLPQNP